MRHALASPPAAHRGLTLLEVMISMGILAVGLLGMLQLQILGMTANQGARAHTMALQLGRELVQGLEQLPFGDDSLRATGTAATDPTQAPEPFGALLDFSGTISGEARVWDDTKPVPGVRLDSQIPERDRNDSALPAYQRRWMVWDYVSATGGASVKLIAVSVIFHERTIVTPREVVLFTQRANTGLVLSNVAAFR